MVPRRPGSLPYRKALAPLAGAVVFAMMASYLLSRTLIPTMVHYMLKPEVKLYATGRHGETEGGQGLFWRVHYLFNRRFEMMRASYTGLLHWSLDHRALVLTGFGIFVIGSLALIPLVGRFLSHRRFRVNLIVVTEGSVPGTVEGEGCSPCT